MRMMVERHKIDSWTIGSKVTYMRLTTFDHLAEVIDWQMNVEAEKSHQDYHQLRRCIELQIEMHRAPIRAKHPSHHPDCPLHGTLAHC